MTNITFSKNKVIIDGHSGYGTKGNDIICSAISSIATTTIRAILKYDTDSIKVTTDEALIEVIVKQNDVFINILIDNMKELFKELEEKYPKYIKMEVII